MTPRGFEPPGVPQKPAENGSFGQSVNTQMAKTDPPNLAGFWGRTLLADVSSTDPELLAEARAAAIANYRGCLKRVGDAIADELPA